MTFVGITSHVHGRKKKEWNEYKCRHFIIYYKEAPLDFVKTIEEAAEDYYAEITNSLGFTRYKSWSWDKRAKIYIYNDSEDYTTSSQQAKWSHGSASVRDKVIRTFPAAHGFFDSVLPHEMGHIIFREFVGFKADVPLWFEEGVAMYQEKARRWGANREVKEAMDDGRFIPLGDLTNMRLYSSTDRALVEFFYAESASAVYFIITELGEHRFANFCKQLKRGKRFEEAIRSVYIRYKDIDDLNKAWVNYIK